MTAFRIEIDGLAQKELDDLRSDYPNKFSGAAVKLDMLQSETGNVAFQELSNSKHIKKLKGSKIYWEFCWPKRAKGGVVRVIFRKRRGSVLNILIADLKKSGSGDPYKTLLQTAKSRDH